MRKKIILSILILLSLCLITGYAVVSRVPLDSIDTGKVPAHPTAAEKEEVIPANPIGKASGVNTVLEIQGKKYGKEIAGNSTVYDFMNQIRDRGDVSFTDKTYTGMGKLITSIDGMRSDGEYTWIYYVNGIEAEKGVSNYIISPGDVVSWKYEKLHY